MSDWGVLGLEGDPTPGDPDGTAELAGRLLHQAEMAERNRQRLAGVAAGGSDLGMEGDYAPKFREVLAELPGELGKLSSAYRGAGEALRAFASDLREEKSRAGAALRQGRDAAARYDGALREIRGLLPGGRDLVVFPMLGVEASVEQATEGLDEATRAQARVAARRAQLADQERNAARRLADQAARLRADAEDRAAEGINRALDHSGIKNKSWWQKAWDVVSWPFQSWDHFVSFCRGAAVVVGVVALFVSGPVGWALVGVALAAGAVAFGDTLVKYTQGKASLLDLGLDALGLIPGSAGAIKLAGMGTRLAGAGSRLAAMARDLPETGRLALGALRNARGAFAESIRAGLQEPRVFARDMVSRFVRGDPVDMATGEVILRQDPDLHLPGLLSFTLQRTYRSAYRCGRWFGRSWSSTIEHRLEVDALGVCYAADDGLLFAYPTPRLGESVLPQEGPRRPLTRTAEGLQVADPTSGQTLHFVVESPDGDRSAAVLPLSAITDRNGHRIDLDYAPDGSLIAIGHSGDYHLDVDTEEGRITEIRLRTPPGEADLVLMRYQYDQSGNLTGVVNSSGRPLRFDYDDHGRMTAWTDRNGTWYRYTYDDLDRCIAGTGTDGYLNRTFAYDKSEGVTVEANSLGQQTTYHYNDLLQIERVVNALGGVTTYEWDRYERKLGETDPLGRTTRWTYDDAGNLVEITRPDGSQATLTYNDLGLPVTVTGPDGALWQREYDQRGNLLAETDPLGATTTYAYDEQGHRRQVTDALGYVHQIETDAAGLPLSVTDPLGATTKYVRDRLGRVAHTIDALGGTTSLSWTVEGMLRSRSLPDDATERWRYDPEGNLVEQIDALGQVTRTEIGPFDLPTGRVTPDGARVTFAYDTELRLVSVTNPQGFAWRYDYDPAGNVVRETDYGGRMIDYGYDAAGQLVSRRHPDNETMHFAVDALGNVVEQRSGDAVSRFSYDRLGRLVGASNGDCDLTFERDLLGRILAETCNGRTVTSVYDALGRRVERRVPSGAVSITEYGPSDQPLALHAGSRSLSFAYDKVGREVQRRLIEGLSMRRAWDARSRLLSQDVTLPVSGSPEEVRIVQRRSYTYRADGYAVGVEDLLAGPRRWDVDAVGRITAVTAPGGGGWSERYAYDVAGNVVFGAWPSPAEGFAALDAQGEREYDGMLIRRAGRVRYEHDARGRVVLRQEKRLSERVRTWRYVWDADDRLTHVVTPDGRQWGYGYDPLGRRIAKERLDNDGTTVLEAVEFVWDGLVPAEQTLFREAEPPAGRQYRDRTLTWDWEPGSFVPVCQTERPWPSGTSPEPTDERFYAIVTDLAGAPTELVSPGGDIGWSRRDTVWGVPVATGAPTVGCPLRFPGQYFDDETQAHYNFFRQYDPYTARYLTSDPVGLALGPHPYAYIANPFHWIDPLGLGPYRVAPRASRRGILTGDHSFDDLGPLGPDLEGLHGVTDPRTGDITINSRLPAAEAAQTLRHEMVHQRIVRGPVSGPVSRALYGRSATWTFGEEALAEYAGTSSLRLALSHPVGNGYLTPRMFAFDAAIAGGVGVSGYFGYEAAK